MIILVFLLLIDMNARVAWISTTGSAIVFFDNSKIDEILDKVTPILQMVGIIMLQRPL